jgi:hypothetical protein
MVLQPFSIPEHIPKIKSGEKTQTTRKGIRDLKVGTWLQQYYRPRMKRGTCANCIQDCELGSAECTKWTNYFGEVQVTSIKHYPYGLQELNKIEFDGWALCDGFESSEQAEEWFENQYGIGWRQIPMTVIRWDNSLRVIR